MKKRLSGKMIFGLLCISVILFSALAPVQAEEIIYSDDFEAGQGNWSISNGVWEVGAPTAGPSAAHGGSNCAGTILGGNYPEYVDSRLSSPSVTLPTVAAGEELQLRFWQWFSYGNGSGKVQISDYDEATGTWSGWKDISSAIGGTSVNWTPRSVDLTAYAGKKVRLAFYHDAYYAPALGWYIDDVTVVRFTPNFAGDFESGWGDWYPENGIWEVGAPTAGPSAAHGSSNCAGTILDGNYPEYVDSRLISPSLTLPTVAADEELQLRFWQWFSYGNGSGKVQISDYDEATGTWSGWKDISSAIGGTSVNWTPKSVDLTAYAGKKVRLAFYHDAYYAPALGWYIDDVKVVRFTPNFAGDFESGWGDWYPENGIWEVGAPTAGPSEAHGGSNCAGTILAGNYPEYVDSRLISPSLTLPTLAAGEELQLRFWQWFSYGNGSGRVQISDYNQTTGTWSNWQDISSSVGGTSVNWTRSDVDLTSYAEKKVRLAFYHDAYYAPALGWYIDDVQIINMSTISLSPIALTPSCTQGQNAVAQGFEVWNSGGGTLSYSISDDADWLSCAPTPGASTGEHDTITVTYNTSGLTAGTYNATITINAPWATNTSQTIPVTLTVTAVPTIGFSPTTLTPACDQGQNAAADTFQVWNSGTGTLTYAISDDADWLACAPASGTSTGEHDTITVTYSTSGLAAGTYNATVTITAPGATNTPQTITVTLTVTAPPSIGFSPSSLTPSCLQGQNAANQNFEVWNGASGSLSYTISDNAAWLSCSPPSGTSTGEHDTITVTFSTSGLAAGTYNATITVTAAGATNTPQTIPVTLTVTAPPSIGFSPTSLTSSCTPGHNAANQSFEVWNGGGGTLSYTITDNAAWLACTPASGTSAGEHNTITVIYPTSGLAAGTYNANITITAAGATNNPRTIPVTLTVKNTLDNGLVAYYPFTGNANDESGNGNHGTINDATLTTDRFGKSNCAYYFNGSSSYIKARAGGLPTAERTVSLWFKADDLNGGPVPLSYGGGGCGDSWFMCINHTELPNTYHLEGHCNSNELDYAYKSPPIGSWYHWAITTSANGTKMFINGNECAGSGLFVSNTYVIDKDLSIGACVDPSGYAPYADSNVTFFKGALDEIRIYNRALSSSEIKQLYGRDGLSSMIQLLLD